MLKYVLGNTMRAQKKVAWLAIRNFHHRRVTFIIAVIPRAFQSALFNGQEYSVHTDVAIAGPYTVYCILCSDKCRRQHANMSHVYETRRRILLLEVFFHKPASILMTLVDAESFSSTWFQNFQSFAYLK